jgi:hypothetical protein
MVRENYDGFTRKQVEGVTVARHLMGVMATPSTCDFQALVCLNLLKDCPVTNDDTKNAHTLYSLDLATIKGKTVWPKPTRVVTDYVDILWALVDMNQRVTLAADVMFVNSVPFLVSVLRNKNLIMIKHAPHHTATKLGSLIQCTLCVYAQAGFTVQTILMDNEFEKLRDHVPMLALNIPAAGDHIREVEQCIWVIKECPYSCLPQQMLIHLVHFVTMWLNNFPTSNGILADFSPCKIILLHRLSYKCHCRASFGAYCKTHEDNTPTNLMCSCALQGIFLGPTGNFQGSYHFLNLATGCVIKRQIFD